MAHGDVGAVTLAESRSRRRRANAAIVRADASAEALLFLLSLVSLPTLLVSTRELSNGDRTVVRAVAWVIWLSFVAVVSVRVVVHRARRHSPGTLAAGIAIVVGLPLLIWAVNLTAGLAIVLVHPVARVLHGWHRGALGRTWRFVTDKPLSVLAIAVPFMWLLAASLVFRLETGDPRATLRSIGSSLWWSAATMSTVGYGDVTLITPWGRVIGVGTMVVGIASFSVLTAKLAESLLVQRDRRAHSEVDCHGHVLVIGWSPKVFTIVRELVLANADQAHADVVVVGDRPAEEMERDLVARVPEMFGATTTVTCRTGTSWEQVDIVRAHPERAKSIVVLDDDGDSASVMKTALLLLSGNFAVDVPVIVEVGDAATAAALRHTFGARVLPVEAGSLLARVTAQSCRQPGLGLCYQELFDFEGSEMYVVAIPEASGRRFGDLLACFESSIPVGIAGGGGAVALCPPMDRVVGDDDRLIVLAHDDSLISWTGFDPFEPVEAPATPAMPNGPERILIFGWNDFAGQLLVEIDRRVEPGSRITVAVDTSLTSGTPTPHLPLRNTELEFRAATGAEHAELVAVLAEDDSEHTIVLCYGSALSPGEADARALLTMMQIRRALTDRGEGDRSIICELLDERDVDLAPPGSVNDFIVSQQLSSLMMAQLAETPELAEVFHQIFDPDGAELYSSPAMAYCQPGESLTFGTVVATARLRDQIAIGYRLVRDGKRRDRNFGVNINPAKSAEVCFEPDDRLLVLGQPPR